MRCSALLFFVLHSVALRWCAALLVILPSHPSHHLRVLQGCLCAASATHYCMIYGRCSNFTYFPFPLPRDVGGRKVKQRKATREALSGRRNGEMLKEHVSRNMYCK